MVKPIGDGDQVFDTAFDRDEATIVAYEKAKQRHLRALTEKAEIALRATFAERRETVIIEIDKLRDRVKVKSREADAAVAAYALRLPHRVAKTGVTAPSWWERIITLNKIVAFYRAAERAATEVEVLNATIRANRVKLDSLDRELRRAIYLREEAARKQMETPAGLAAFHAEPMNGRLFAELQRVLNERAAYEERVRNGEVPPAEARDRDMSQRRQRFAQVPLIGAIIARIVRYGPLEYYVLRDLENAEYLLAANPSLEPLRDLVFDVTPSAAGIDAALRYSTAEVPMRVLDHLRASQSSADAAEAYARHRAALRTDRPRSVTAASSASEAAVAGALTMLAEAVAAAGIAVTVEPLDEVIAPRS